MRERFKTAALTVRESRDGGGFPIQSVDRGKDVGRCIYLNFHDREISSFRFHQEKRRKKRQRGRTIFFFSFRVCLNETLNVAFVETAHEKICLGTCSVGVNKSPING